MCICAYVYTYTHIQTHTQICICVCVCMHTHMFSSVQSSHSVVSKSLWPQRLQHARLPCQSPTARACSLMSIYLVMPSNYLILCYPLVLPSIFLSIRVFSNKPVLHIRWPKYWNFSFSISPSNENLGLICFSMDWLDLLADQGTLKSLLQHPVQKCQFFRAQLSL